MVDFTSTNTGVDDQTARCARLVAALIAQAIRDLAIPPTEAERSYGANLLPDPYESLKFFYDETSPFKHYALMVGFDAEPFLHNLENRDFDADKYKHPFLQDRDLRIIRRRIKWYKITLAEMKNAGPK